MCIIASIFSCKVRRSLVVQSARVIAHLVHVGAICRIAAKERPVVLQSSWRRAKGSSLLSSAPFSTVTRRRQLSHFFPFSVVVEIRVGLGGDCSILALQKLASEFLRVLAMSAKLTVPRVVAS